MLAWIKKMFGKYMDIRYGLTGLEEWLKERGENENEKADDPSEWK
jgi:hypothetical protein